MKNKTLVKWCLILILFFDTSILYADSLLDIQKKIEISKKANQIEALSKRNDAKAIAKLKQFLKDENKGVRKTATWVMGDKSAVQPCDQYFSKREEQYLEFKKNIAHFSREKKEEYLLNYLFDFKSLKEYTSNKFTEYELAAILLIQMGNEIVPDILKLLSGSDNIPTIDGNSWDEGRKHKYNFLLIILKSIPDTRSIPKLEELSKSNIKYVAEKAREALEWIRSGVSYPFQYERILFSSEDDIYPIGE